MTRSVYWKDVAFPTDVADLRSVGNEGMIVPGGATIERPAVPQNGTIRYNSTIGLTEVYQGAAWSTISTTGISGEANTASNLGAGQAVFASKVGFDLQFKSIRAGTNVSIGSNANEIIINAVGTGEVNTASNVGAGTGTVFDSKIGPDLQFKSLRSINPNLTIVNNANTIDFDFTGGVGETNDGINLGGGGEVFLNKVGLNLRFRTITGIGNEISINPTSTELEVGLADNPVMPGSASMVIPSGPTASEPAPIDGMIRYDTTAAELRAVIAGAWQTVETSIGTFLPLTGGTMNGDIVLAAGVNIIGGNMSNITLQAPLIMVAGADIDMSAGGDIVMQAAATVDGRDIDVDGVVLDNINTTGSFGMVARTADPNVFERRTLTGTADQIVVSNGNGVSGNPTFSIADNPAFGGTGSMVIPFGTTAQQPAAPTDGMFRINTTDNVVEYYIGGNWIRSISTIGGAVTGGDIDMGGNNITNVGLTDGRDLGADGAVIDEINAITANTGVLVKSTTGILSRLITASSTNSLAGIEVDNGTGVANIEIGLDINNLSNGSPFVGTEQLVVYNTTSATNVRNSIDDIVTYIGNSGVIAEIDVPGEFGLVARVADGSPVGDFERRSIVSATSTNRAGIEITNGDGASGNPVIGLALNSLPVSSVIGDVARYAMFTPGSGTNFLATADAVRSNIMRGAFRASGTTVAVPNGVSAIPFSISTGDFDPDTLFNDAADTFTPPAGTVEISAYAEASGSTVAGTYILRIRRNGTPEGNIGVLVADGTNPATAYVTDSFVASGTDVFTVEINNTTGGASTIEVVRFYARRIY